MIIEYISQRYQNKYHKGHDALEQGGTSYTHTLEVHGHFKYSSKTSTKKQKHIIHFVVECEA